MTFDKQNVESLAQVLNKSEKFTGIFHRILRLNGGTLVMRLCMMERNLSASVLCLCQGGS